MFFLQDITEKINIIKNTNNIRTLKRSQIDNDTQEKTIDFSSNDYLGLSKSFDSLEFALKIAKKYGSGSTGSRLLSGNNEFFETFEKKIAIDKKTQTSLIFNSGFDANFGVLSTICDENTLVIFDKLNHASMYDGIFLSRSPLHRFAHLDYNQLENILKKENKFKKKIIVSETVFGMDGDCADISTLANLAEKYNAILYLDEAHATGLYGPNGYGLSTKFNLNDETTIIMGTFSKALAACGAYIACSKLIKEYLIQKCRPFIYSTALPPFCIGLAQYNWNKIPSLQESRKKLLILSDLFREKNSIQKENIQEMSGNIFIIVTNNLDELHQTILENNIITSAIRRPTSPTPRIRIAINCSHSKYEISQLCDIITSYNKKKK